MTVRRQFQMCIVAAILATGTLVPLMAADTAATAPAVAAARSEQAIVADLRTTSAQMHVQIPSLSAVADETQRKEVAEKAIPVLRKMASLIGELGGVQTDPNAKASLQMQQYQFQSFLIAFGDKDATAAVQAMARSADAEKSVPAQCALALGQWWQNSKDVAAQTKLLATLQTVAKGHPASENIATTLGMMAELGAANDALKKQAFDIVRTTLKSDAATSIIAEADAMQAQKDLEGKPLIVAGRTTTGGTFTSADWKGKVILVDMWATWCGPCKEELPRTKKLYDDYHAKGLEIVGLDCDTADDGVNAFIKENGMAWPQLRELSQNDSQWHPLATQWHVMGIPTMFLIDRKGVLRYVDGREDTETKVKALLAEDAPK